MDLILKAVGEGYFPGSFLVTAKKMVDELEKKIEEESRYAIIQEKTIKN